MEDFMNQHKQPNEKFAGELRDKLRAQERQQRRATPTTKIIAGIAATALATVSIFSVPSIGAAAQGFLDLFRVKRITVVSFDQNSSSLAQLDKLDPRTLFASEPQFTKQAAPQTVKSIAEASALTGYAVKAPAAPRNWTQTSIEVNDAADGSFTPDVNKMNAALQLMGINDLKVPTALNGATINVKLSKSVKVSYRNSSMQTVNRASATNSTIAEKLTPEQRALVATKEAMLSGRPQGAELDFVQMPTPEINLPASVNMADLGEIGLRLIGMSASEARQYAHSIDWSTTLVMPIPTQAASFREVTIHNVKGVLVTSKTEPPQNALMWTENDMLYGISGALSSDDMIVLANSVQ